MSIDLGAALAERFGPEGLRRFPALASRVLPGVEFLHSVGLPVQVGLYFKASDDPDTPGVEGVAGGGSRPRLGTDGGAQVYLAEDGTVRAALLGYDLPELVVNSGAEQFAAALLALDRQLPLISGAADEESALDAYRSLRTELLAIDPAAFDDRESWWPRVLDDLRHPLNVRSSAALEYVDESGEKRIVTEATAPGLPHPEELVWYRLHAAGVQPEAVTRVFTEFEACLMPGHYCALWMARTFPQAEFTHRFDYGWTAASREDAVRALMVHLAERD